MSGQATRIAVIGDIHLEYTTWDNDYFNQSPYDLLLFVGDLNDLFRPDNKFLVAALLSKLKKPAILIPGNHDVHNGFQIITEILRVRWLAAISGYYHYDHHERLTAALSPIEVAGYSLHPYQGECVQFDLIAARPYAMGDSSISFAPLLRSLYGVKSVEQSTKLLCRMVDLSESENLIFLAHNGPAGLGDDPGDIWGCDFDPGRGDFGDLDLRDAISYAQKQGKRILAVIAGHMHLQTYLGPKPIWKRRGEPGPERPFSVAKDGVLYVNAARVPRIFEENGKLIHHHVCLEITDLDVDVREMFIEEG